MPEYQRLTGEREKRSRPVGRPELQKLGKRTKERRRKDG